MTDPHQSPLRPTPVDDGSATDQTPSTPDPQPQQDPPQEFDLGQSLRDSMAQLEGVVREIPHQSERAFQQTWASWQLRWGGQAKDLREHLLSGLAITRISTDLEPLHREVAQVLQQLPPSQMEVLIGSLPLASDRALVASVYGAVVQLDPQPDPKHRAAAARSYGLSGLPIVIGIEDQVRVDASAALVSAIVSIELAGSTATTALSFLGTRELKQLLKADGQLRSKALSQGRKLLPTEESWQLLKQILNRSEENGTDRIWDGPLALTQLGIEGAQLAEFLAEQIKAVLNMGLLRAFTPPIVMEALQLLTSDLLFSVGFSMESALESSGAARRMELVLEALPKAQRLPSPEQVLAYTPQVLAAADRRLRPLLTKQIMTVANSLDPQMRNSTLNQIGQQLNLWNPWQFLGGWQARDWLSSTLGLLQQLELCYPTLESLQIYAVGLEEALGTYRVMEQAQLLRTVAKQIDAESAED